MHADVLTRLLLDLGEEIDGVRLQRGDVGVGIEGVDAAGGMPARPGGQHVALDDGDVGPAELGQVVEDAGADDSTPDDNYPVLRLHGSSHACSETSLACVKTAGASGVDSLGGL